jgi:hypothetical protein
MTDGPVRIQIDFHNLNVASARAELQRDMPAGVTIASEPRNPKDALALDSAVSVALIMGGAQVLGAFVTGLLGFLSRHRDSKIVLQKGDLRLEFPAETAPQQRGELLAQLEALDRPRIIIAR